MLSLKCHSLWLTLKTMCTYTACIFLEFLNNTLNILEKKYQVFRIIVYYFTNVFDEFSQKYIFIYNFHNFSVNS